MKKILLRFLYLVPVAIAICSLFFFLELFDSLKERQYESVFNDRRNSIETVALSIDNVISDYSFEDNSGLYEMILRITTDIVDTNNGTYAILTDKDKHILSTFGNSPLIDEYILNLIPDTGSGIINPGDVYYRWIPSHGNYYLIAMTVDRKSVVLDTQTENLFAVGAGVLVSLNLALNLILLYLMKNKEKHGRL